MKVEMRDESRGEQFRLSMQAVEETGFSILERLEKRSSDTMDELQAHIKRIEKFRSFKMASEYASAIRAIEAGVLKLLEPNTLEGDVRAIDKTSRSTATDVKKLVKRLGKDDGKTVELLEDIQAKLLGISKQMRVTENKDIKRWDALMSHLNRDRWWQVWKWPVWNFRVSFTRRED